MKTITLVSAVCLSVATSLTRAAGDPDMASALATCREEAASTGLVEQADITAYVDLCMQAWQPVDGYTESYAPAEAIPEEPAGYMQEESPDTASGEEPDPTQDDGSLYQ
jgi:hypothetical protein